MFKKKVDPKEAARDAKSAVRRGERDIEKELRNLDREEQKLIANIKRTAKTGNQSATKTLAKQLVGLRAQRERLYTSKANIAAVGYQTTAMAGTANMAQIMGSVAGVMKNVNDSVSAADTAKIMQEFAKQNEMMGMREDIMSDALADAFDGEGVEEDSNAIVDQVLQEIGLDMAGKMQDAPSAQPAAQAAARAAEEDALLDQRAEDLMKQLNAL